VVSCDRGLRGLIAVTVSRRKSEFGAAGPAEAGRVAPLTPPHGAFVLWQCESGSGAFLDVLRCVLSDRRLRDGFACDEAMRSEAFGSIFDGTCCVLSE